jgi:uncharacterized membrane protein YcjF (UPF0283 family)
MQQKSKKAWWESGVQLFAQISGWIVFPIIGAIYLGRWLDNKYDKEPWFFLLCVGLAFIITNVGVVKVGLEAMRKVTKEETMTPQDGNNDNEKIKKS